MLRAFAIVLLAAVAVALVGAAGGIAATVLKSPSGAGSKPAERGGDLHRHAPDLHMPAHPPLVDAGAMSYR